ncbi:MAG: hypothetical protein IKT40_06255 [Bacilli bacterium]|nr:hypothetical protein [Bacilli bacterium]
MKIKDYFELYDEMLTTEIRQTYAPYLTIDGQAVINEILKYEYAEKEMFLNDKETIENQIKMILLKNNLEYSKIKDFLDNQINPNITNKITTTPAETTVTHTPAETQTTHTPAEYTKTMTPSESTQTRTLPGQTVTDGGTEINKTVTETKPFDSDVFIETEQTTDTTTPTTTSKTEYDNDEVTKYSIDAPSTETLSITKEEETEIMVLKDEITKSETDTPETVEEIKTSEEIDNYLKYIEMYKINLYVKIVDDILDILTFRTWETSWFDL